MQIKTLLWLATACLIFLPPTRSDVDALTRRLFVVWNVGQGQWVTLTGPRACVHFDSGGEKNKINVVTAYCGRKKNIHFLSHYDWDHLSFVRSLRQLRHLCRQGEPSDPTHPKNARRYRQIPQCRDTTLWEKEVHELSFPLSIRKARANDFSRVFVVHGRFLVPGDSTARAEKLWVPLLSAKVNGALGRDNPRGLGTGITWLVLGHHGSNTSTSEGLLRSLPNLLGGVASARQRRYGHPHPKVVQRLQEFHVGVLTTEAWGTLAFEL